MKDFLPLNHYYRRTHTALCSSPYTMSTSGGCTRKPKHPSGQRKRSTSRWTSRIGTDYLPINATLSPMFLCSLLPPMALSTRNWAAILPPKWWHSKLNASTASKLWWKTFTAKRSPSSLTCASRTQRRNYTCSMPSKQYHAFKNPKQIESLNGATPPAPALQNEWLYLLPSKASSSQAHLTPYFGSKSANSCLALVSAMNSSAATKGSTLTLHASSTPNWLAVFPKNVSSIS